MADAEFTFEYDAVAAAVVFVSCFLGLLIVTVVQSWQSGVCGSGVLYLFFDMAGGMGIYTIHVIGLYLYGDHDDNDDDDDDNEDHDSDIDIIIVY
jgi:hypothetical protein